MSRPKSLATFMSEHRAGDALLIQFEGVLPVEVERVSFRGRRVVYRVRAALTMDVPASLVVGRDEKGEDERAGAGRR
jgi:hypothetical protein